MVMSHSLEKTFCLGTMSTNVHHQVLYWCDVVLTTGSGYRTPHPLSLLHNIFKSYKGVCRGCLRRHVLESPMHLSEVGMVNSARAWSGEQLHKSALLLAHRLYLTAFAKV